MQPMYAHAICVDVFGMFWECLWDAFGMPLRCLQDTFWNLVKLFHSLVCISFFHYRSQMEGISSHRKHNPFKSKVIMALYALLSCIMRAAGLVIYVVLTLGLLDSLRHLQGSQDTISIQVFKLEINMLLNKHEFSHLCNPIKAKV